MNLSNKSHYCIELARSVSKSLRENAKLFESKLQSDSNIRVYRLLKFLNANSNKDGPLNPSAKEAQFKELKSELVIKLFRELEIERGKLYLYAEGDQPPSFTLNSGDAPEVFISESEREERIAREIEHVAVWRELRDLIGDARMAFELLRTPDGCCYIESRAGRAELENFVSALEEVIDRVPQELIIGTLGQLITAGTYPFFVAYRQCDILIMQSFYLDAREVTHGSLSGFRKGELLKLAAELKSSKRHFTEQAINRAKAARALLCKVPSLRGMFSSAPILHDIFPPEALETLSLGARQEVEEWVGSK